MNIQEFQQLTQQGIVILDGATGSNFRRAGMPVGVSGELWALEHPEVVIELQRAYVDAGSQIVYAPTFSANRIGLGMHGLEGRLQEINAGLVALSKRAADGRALVAGDITTTGKILEPQGDMTYQQRLRLNEALMGAWTMGERGYPLFSMLPDVYLEKYLSAVQFSYDIVLQYMVRCYRQYKPLVVFTQDLEGEYGHWQHKQTARCALDAIPLAADSTYDRESAEKYGVWQV